MDTAEDGGFRREDLGQRLLEQTASQRPKPVPHAAADRRRSQLGLLAGTPDPEGSHRLQLDFQRLQRGHGIPRAPRASPPAG